MAAQFRLLTIVMVVLRDQVVVVAAHLPSEPQLSVILPVLNEGRQICEALSRLSNPNLEVIVVDGGSTDDTVALVQLASNVQLVHSEAGRAKQMNAGAELASADVLLFLHGDSLLPDDFLNLVVLGLVVSEKEWGRFDLKLSGSHPMFRIVEFMINWRSGLTGVCTGDQAVFVTKALFKSIGGFPDQALMEDIALTSKLRRAAKPLRIRERLTTSSRRWEQGGVFRTIWLMWSLRLRYFFGADGNALAKQYRSNDVPEKN